MLEKIRIIMLHIT